MGTNYYFFKEENKCECCGRSDKERLHIGKSSCGWHFTLHVMPEDKIKTLDDWIFLFKHGIIMDEYNSLISPETMIGIITKRSSGNTDIDYPSMRENGAEQGFNNLWRHKKGMFCIGHGKGTYDYVVGEFS